MERNIVGKTIEFGKYRIQYPDSADRIEWIVLAEQDGKTLLLSKYAIEAMHYHEKYEETTWERCTLRRWLNWSFYDCAFSRAEKDSIIQIRNQNHDYCEVTQRKQMNDPDYPNIIHNINVVSELESLDTLDKVFLLSCDELEQYKHIIKTLWVKPTPYAEKKGVATTLVHDISDNGNFHQTGTRYCEKWWLRNRGLESDQACYSTGRDIISKSGFPVYFHETVLEGVRPAIWVKSSSFLTC